MNPGSDMPCGCASSDTGTLPSLNEASTLRRVESESAANTASRAASEYLTMQLSINLGGNLVKCGRCRPAHWLKWQRLEHH